MSNDVHPGLETLRRLIPSESARRDFVRLGVEYLSEGLTGNSYAMLLAWGVMDATAEEAIEIDRFLEWI